MITGLIVFGTLAAVLLYAVPAFGRLPDDEFVRRLRAAGTGRLLRVLTLAAPGILVSMVLATAAFSLALATGEEIATWERVTVGVLFVGVLTVATMAAVAAFTGRPKVMLFRQARDPEVRKAVAR
jgi:hypothetical protein